MSLLNLTQGEKAIITKVKGRGAFRKRIMEMGFLAGKEITVVKKAPLGDPVEYNIMGYNVSLRNSEAGLIEIITEADAINLKESEYHGTFSSDFFRQTAEEKGKTINVALVGNPNSGKTTIFNFASGSRERVGNYSGVTVDAKEAHFKHNGFTFNVTDLPGTYSISAYSPEELFVRDFIFEKLPDVVVNVIDSSNIERNLYLTTQLIDMDIKVVVALNMYDEMQKNGDRLDEKQLGKLIGIPFVPTIGSRGKGINELIEKIIEVYEDKDKTVRHIHINYGNAIEKGISVVQEKIRIPENRDMLHTLSSRFLSIKLLEKDAQIKSKIKSLFNAPEIEQTYTKEIKRLETELLDDTETLITDAKYGFIAGALKETFKPSREARVKKSELVDVFITHKIWGIPIFIGFMWLMFYLTFSIGNYPKTWLEEFVSFVGNTISQNMSDGMLKDLLIQGIISGVGGVIIFLPNIMLLFLFISIMEDTGYMARAVFIMDKAMHKIGLHGKSFIPLLMGFGCNVPAILSTRIIESKRDRLITILINPFMSCSARLPVYILMISAFFASYQASILFSLYAIGISIAIISALLLRKTFFRESDVPFVMELPPYRLPTVRSLVKHMWQRSAQYLKKIGGIILLGAIIVWALGYFPRHADNDLAQESSYIGRIGKFIEPVMRPLGFDWKMSVSVVTGVAAKEIVVGTIGVLHHASAGDNEKSGSIIQKLQNDTYDSGPKKGEKVYSPLVAFSFMLFILIYFPCIAALAAIKKESGSWKWALFSIVYNTSLAWLVSFIVFQTVSLF